jgi:hypothetical protein
MMSAAVPEMNFAVNPLDLIDGLVADSHSNPEG